MCLFLKNQDLDQNQAKYNVFANVKADICHLLNPWHKVYDFLLNQTSDEPTIPEEAKYSYK